MNAWVEAGRFNTFSNVRTEDVVFRSTYLTNSLILGNGLFPKQNAALYINSNCIGINRIPDLAANIVLDIGGAVACRSSFTWSDPAASSAEVVSGSNGIRASAAGIVLNNGSMDTLSLDSTGHIQTRGTLYASNAYFGHHTSTSTSSDTNLDVLTVMGRGLFDDGVCLVADPRETKDASLVYDSSTSVLTLGSKLTVGSQGLRVNGSIVSTGQMFAPGYKVLSDVRLKRDIIQSDRHSDLMDVMAVDVKRYTLADNGAYNSGERHIGVLAHDLSAIMPDAVCKVEDYLPNVMASARVHAQTDTGTWVVFQAVSRTADNTPPPQRHIFQVGDSVRLRSIHESVTLTAQVEYVDGLDCLCISAPGCRVLQKMKVGSELFVYGTLCRDVMAVDTTHVLFRLVSAVQTLHTELEEMRRFVATLKDKQANSSDRHA